MVRQRSGHIINTASVAGLIASPGSGSYTGTKHAVVGLSKTLRIEARRHGVRVSVLCPGAIRTPILTGGRFGRLRMVGALIGDVTAAARQAHDRNGGQHPPQVPLASGFEVCGHWARAFPELPSRARETTHRKSTGPAWIMASPGREELDSYELKQSRALPGIRGCAGCLTPHAAHATGAWPAACCGNRLVHRR